jgi:hypothetical protein
MLSSHRLKRGRGYATRTGAGGAGSSSGRAVIDSPAPVLLGAGAISGSGICMSS